MRAEGEESTIMCPHSAPWLCAPSIVISPMMMPPPTPVPSVRRMRLVSSRPEPTQNSPYAAAVASFAYVTVWPQCSATRSRTGKFSQPGRLPGLSKTPVERSCGPGVPRPTAAMSERARPTQRARSSTECPIRTAASSGPFWTLVGSV